MSNIDSSSVSLVDQQVDTRLFGEQILHLDKGCVDAVSLNGKDTLRNQVDSYFFHLEIL